MSKATRQEVYLALDGEREYQERKLGSDQRPYKLVVDPWLLYIQDYTTEAIRQATRGDGASALETVRKITALGVACMEHCGAPRRQKP